MAKNTQQNENSVQNKEPEFKNKINLKPIVKTVVIVILGVSALTTAGYFLFYSKPDVDKNKINYGKDKIEYNNLGVDDENSLKKLIKNNNKDNSSDSYNSQVDINVSNIISGNNDSNKLSNGDKYTPLYTTTDTFDLTKNYDSMTDDKLREELMRQNGEKIVKIGSYKNIVDDTNWREKELNKNKSQSPIALNNTDLQTNLNAVKFPMLITASGKKVLGFDASGKKAIVGYDVNGKPIYESTEGMHTISGKPITVVDAIKSINEQQNGNKILYDSNGKPIIGYDSNGKPIIGYDSNGKPILGNLPLGVDGYDSNKNPIKSTKDFLYKDGNIRLFDKDGKPIIGYSNGKPIVGYDSNGNPVYGKVEQGVAGYTKDGRVIKNTELDGLLVKEGVQNQLNKIGKGLVDKDGKPIIGYSNGQPIVGYDKNGKPIIGKVEQGVIGYDENGRAIKTKDLQTYLQSNLSNDTPKSDKPALYDKNGNLIIGYDENGKPIIGYSNGKPIIGVVDKSVVGYDENGNPITKSQLKNYYDKNNSNGNSIVDSQIIKAGSATKVPNFEQNTGGNLNVPPITNTGVAINATQPIVRNQVIQQIESKPWSEALAKSADGADKSKLEIKLSFSDLDKNESNQQNQNSSNSGVAQSQIAVNNVNDSQFSQQSQQNQSVSMQPSNSSYGDSLTVKNLITPFTIKAGDIIPLILRASYNSDLPGEILGVVSENVYDTATGKYLLIPQGSKLRGSYSSNVTYGQERIMIAWNSLVFPDGREIILKGQPGTDLAGMAGMYDKVNRHYWSIFGNAFLLSALTAGLEYNQNNNANSLNNGSSFSASLSNSSGQMMGQAAASIIQKSLNIAPTLTGRIGLRGNIMLIQDVVLPSPYVVKIYNPTITYQ